ncbi:MAG: dihydroorotase [Cyclobacteriaceae bacterium]|nr:dihydroorotase [Cyclobacteriaceae bacterium]MDW8330688.1 dihydroorotase [Cyclobacteriaceae bacterium]
MKTTLLLNANIVNEGRVFPGDVLINGTFIERIAPDLQHISADHIIDLNGLHLLPGVIDDQVHFREPGLTHKATIYTEARAAVAGGITSYLEMPNTMPPAFTRELLEQKFQIAAQTSLANYSFYIGASNTNLEEVLRVNPREVCGLKIFMGSSTGDLLVDDPVVLENFFSKVPFLIATHCEDESTIKANAEAYRKRYGEDVPIEYHPLIRSAEGCYRSSSFAVQLARKYKTRLHILHISTARETELFDAGPIESKHITAEACIHHLWFCDEDYKRLGNFIKWNPAIKTASDREGIWKALLDDRIDVIATDHAPHTREEKQQTYFKAPSGGPLVQHSLPAMLEFFHQGKITLEKIVTKMCHNPAILFGIEKRGYIREGYYADLVAVNLNDAWTVSPDNILAKCGWSPFEGVTFRSNVWYTWVSGHLAYARGKFDESRKGMRLTFNR